MHVFACFFLCNSCKQVQWALLVRLSSTAMLSRVLHKPFVQSECSNRCVFERVPQIMPWCVLVSDHSRRVNALAHLECFIAHGGRRWCGLVECSRFAWGGFAGSLPDCFCAVCCRCASVVYVCTPWCGVCFRMLGPISFGIYVQACISRGLCAGLMHAVFFLCVIMGSVVR